MHKKEITKSQRHQFDVIDHFDRHHFERLLRRLDLLAESGDNPSPELNAQYTYELLQYLRMRRARRLLESEELSVKEISAAVGYPNALNFSTEFRRRTGMSPREYRSHIARLF